MRSLKLLILIILLYSPVNANMKNAFDFKFNSIDSEEISLSKYKGKTILIVNVASKCGFTNQYKGLQSLWDEYKNKDFVVELGKFVSKIENVRLKDRMAPGQMSPLQQ